MMYYTKYKSPVGELLLISDGEFLTGLYMENSAHPVEMQSEWVESENIPVFQKTVEQLTEYFNGVLTSFDLLLKTQGTVFQEKVWTALRKIPYGETISYQELATRIGNPKAFRAVGLANGRNPISIIVPCHRVIGANGDLVGYGGGLDRKAQLLELEKSVVSNVPSRQQMLI